MDQHPPEQTNQQTNKQTKGKFSSSLDICIVTKSKRSTLPSGPAKRAIHLNIWRQKHDKASLRVQTSDSGSTLTQNLGNTMLDHGQPTPYPTQSSKYILVQWNRFSVVTGCTWVTCIQWRQRNQFHCTRLQGLCACPCSHQPSHSVDRAGWQAKMASIEFWIPLRNAHRPHCKKTQISLQAAERKPTETLPNTAHLFTDNASAFRAVVDQAVPTCLHNRSHGDRIVAWWRVPVHAHWQAERSGRETHHPWREKSWACPEMEKEKQRQKLVSP